MKPEFREKINAQLKILPGVTPQKYYSIIEEYGFEAVLIWAYWEMISDYVIARCPICGETYEQAVDTYSLYLWYIEHFMDNVKFSERGYKRCEHFLGVHTFLKLNKIISPTDELEKGYVTSSEPEVPMVTPTLLPDDVESYAVLHSLPICYAGQHDFYPRHLLYMLTYYTTDPNILKLRRLLEWTQGRKSQALLDEDAWTIYYKRLAIYWEEANTRPEAWDLRYWAEKGKLLWLDPTDPELLLKAEMKEISL